MSITLFFVDAFTSALDRGIAAPSDIIRHVTPDVLAAHLPRSLWARLLTGCLGAPRVDATTIVDTIGIPNLCEHMPKPLLWTCLAEIAATALGSARISSPSIPLPGQSAAAPAAGSPASSGPLLAAAPAPTSGKPARGSSPEMLLPPPPASAAPGGAPTRPASNPGEPITPPVAEEQPSLRARTPTRPPMRGLGTSRISSQAGASSRRPQASAPAAGPGPAIPLPARTAPTAVTVVAPMPQPPRRDELDFEIETDLRADWKAGQDPIPVGDDQLEDWSPNEETASGSSIDGVLDSSRKR